MLVLNCVTKKVTPKNAIKNCKTLTFNIESWPKNQLIGKFIRLIGSKFAINRYFCDYSIIYFDNTAHFIP